MSAEVVPIRTAPADGVELLERARALLAEASSMDEVKDVRDRAEALRAYAKQAGLGLEAQNQAAEVKLRAERRAGELLAETHPLEHGGNRRSSDRVSLETLGIASHENRRWQCIASLPEAAFESYIELALEARREVTTAGALKLAKQTREPVTSHDTPPPVPEGQFSTFVADPPWRYGNTATRAAAEDHYPTMSIEDLCELSIVPERAAEQSHLYLWTTAGHLPDAFKVMEAWGFEYKTYLVWVKKQMGMGNYFRVSTELVLFGIKGGLRTNSRSIKNWFEAPRTKHSAKPLGFHDLVMEASPGPYLELFARCHGGTMLPHGCTCSKCRYEDGVWETWGNQS